MHKFFKILVLIFFNFIWVNSFSFSSENKIKIGLLVPLSGDDKEIGLQIIKSTRIALKDIGSDKLEIFPKDTNSNPNKTIKWLNNLGNPYTNIALDKNGRIAIDWGVYGIPETFIVNSKGIIKYRHVGPITNKSYKKINLIIKETK